MIRPVYVREAALIAALKKMTRHQRLTLLVRVLRKYGAVFIGRAEKCQKNPKRPRRGAD